MTDGAKPRRGAPRPGAEDKRARSTAARLYAVQALFQMEATGTGAGIVQREFETHRIGIEGADSDVPAPAADEARFRRILDAAVTWQARIDQATDSALVATWKIDRIDPVVRALFRAAGAELTDPGVPPRVVIVEYVRLAEAFFPGGREPAFVNGVLDHMARAMRPEAFSAAAG